MNEFKELVEALLLLKESPSLENAKNAAVQLVAILNPEAGAGKFKYFMDGDHKLVSNSTLFQQDGQLLDRRATYALDLSKEANLDVKFYGLTKKSIKSISWAVGLTPNFEDEPFNGMFNVGIDIFAPPSNDRLIVALSKNHIIRTIEFYGSPTATTQKILNTWSDCKDFSRKEQFHQIMWDSLDIQAINNKFYEGISQRFTLLRQHLENRSIFDSSHAAQFANRLLGRVIFVWFLDKKNLLSPAFGYFKSEDHPGGNEFYRSKLEPLFFQVLNTPKEERSFADSITPYLNGGLFEARPGDLYRADKDLFPRDYFDDLFEFLRSYNFTTDESTSTFQQVAIDPEMLGRIFENLLAEVSSETGAQARKAKGAFYTPREIVDYMCREALRNYLRTNLGDFEHVDQRLWQLVDSTDREFHDQDQNWRRDLKPLKSKIISLLDNLRVLDPACGSGAFPIGMMQLLVKVYERIEPKYDSRKTKLAVVENNIFGADIEPMAVEISRLRTWLALVVEEGANLEEVKPLPNLDFKFVCANSLIDLDTERDLFADDDGELERKFQEIREDYFRTQNFSKKKKLREKYSALANEEADLFGETLRTSQLKSFQPFETDITAAFFDSRHMFGVDSFSIVIANPPYIGEKGNKEIFRAVKQSSLGKRFTLGKMDYFYFFFHLGLDLLEQSGVLVFITTNYYPTATSASLLRRDFMSRANLVKLLNFNELKIFKSAAGQHNMVTILQKGEYDPRLIVDTAVTHRSGDADSYTLSSIVSGKDVDTSYFQIEQSKLYSGARNDIILQANRDIDAILDKLATSPVRLRDVADVSKGIETGANEVFVLEEIPRTLFAGNKAPAYLKPFSKNSSISRYSVGKPKKWLIYIDNGFDISSEPSLSQYLLSHRETLEKRAQIVRSNKNWYELLWPRERQIFEPAPKVVTPYRSEKTNFCYLETEFWGGTDVYYLTSKTKDRDLLKVLTAYLNSSLGNSWFRNRGKVKGSSLELTGDNIELFPLPAKQIDPLRKSEIAEHVDRILVLGEQKEILGSEVFEREFLKLYEAIDELVMDAYGLTKEQKLSVVSG